MIKFSPTEDQFAKDGEQRSFLSIRVLDGTDVEKVKEHICMKYGSIADSVYGMDEDEILIELRENVEYGFCFFQLVGAANEIAKSRITWFLLDTNSPTQRMIALESK